MASRMPWMAAGLLRAARAGPGPWRALSTQAAEGLRITPSCAARLRQLAEGDRPKALRVAVDSGGCSGFQYSYKLVDLAELAEAPGAKDKVFEQDGAKVVVDALSYEFLRGAQVDYVQEMVRSSFAVTDNPNSEASCGCGTSFAAK